MRHHHFYKIHALLLVQSYTAIPPEVDPTVLYKPWDNYGTNVIYFKEIMWIKTLH